MADPTRRALLGSAAALAVCGAAVAASAPVAANPPPVLSIHPDAVLLAAWDRYAAGWRAIDDLSAAGRDRDDDPDRVAAYASIDEAQAVLLTAPWRTPDGLVVKLRRLLLATEPSAPVADAVIRGLPLPVGDLGYIADPDRIATTMLLHAEALAGQGGGHA